MRVPYLAILALFAPLGLSSADMHLRFARLTLAEGRVDLEAPVTGERLSGERNLPVGQGYWVETASGRAEIELDEGSVVRLGSGSLAEISDLVRLSTGQRISVVSIERGTMYATAEPAGLDAFLVVAPGLEITFLAGARIRVDVGEESSAVAVLEGRVRFSSRAAELELKEGQTVQVHPKAVDRFQLFREVAAAELDGWSEQRDKESAERARGTKLAPFPVGLGELDAHGKWFDSGALGKVWQPRTPDGWTPFRQGRWRWYNELGYTWVATEPWGWLPYHYGRWAYVPSSGWVWAPGEAGSFHAGEAYWLRGASYVGWGPLATGEAWRAESAPSLYSAANTTFAAYELGNRIIDPVRAPRLPQDPVKAGQFVVGLLAPPPLPAAASARRATRVGTTRILPMTADHTYDSSVPSGIRIVGAEAPPPLEDRPPAPAMSYSVPEAPPVQPPPSEPVYYPQPVYVPEVVIIERDRPRHDYPRGGGGRNDRRNDPPPSRMAPSPAPASPPPAPPRRIDHEPGRGRDRQPPAAAPSPAPAPRPSAPAPAAPPPRQDPPPANDSPEHRTRIRTPEAGDAGARRR